MLATALGFANLLGAGILAGEEFAIRYGVRASIASLDVRPQIELRQTLIRRLRIMVPTVFLLTLLSGAAAAYFSRSPDAPSALRVAALLALLMFMAVTLAGTVPINKAALRWDPSSPPSNWRDRIARWERLDSARTWLAILAFGLFLAAATLR